MSDESNWRLPLFSENSSTRGIEIRCPGKFKKLFLILRQEHLPTEGMFMEIACADCAKEAKTKGVNNVKRALHYFDGTGKCVSTKLSFNNTAD